MKFWDLKHRYRPFLDKKVILEGAIEVRLFFWTFFKLWTFFTNTEITFNSTYRFVSPTSTKNRLTKKIKFLTKNFDLSSANQLEEKLGFWSKSWVGSLNLFSRILRYWFCCIFWFAWFRSIMKRFNMSTWHIPRNLKSSMN